MTPAQLVLVTGPSRAGVTAMATCLRRQLSCPVTESSGEAEMAAASRAAVVVVFVASAVAPLAESDCALAETAAGLGDAMLAVLSKTDDHHHWRRVLDADERLFSERCPQLAAVPWVGAAAAPRLGEPKVDGLVAAVEDALRDTSGGEQVAHRRHSRIGLLRDERAELMLQRRRTALESAAAARREIARSRLSLTHSARRRCAALRADLLADVSVVSRAGVASFPDVVRRRCADTLAAVAEDIAEEVSECTGDLAAHPGLIDVGEPPLRARRLEVRLATVLGAGFGLGVAVVVARVAAALAPGLTAAGLCVGALVGCVTTAWVIGARSLLHSRSVLHGWVADCVAAVRTAAEEMVGTGVLVAESERASIEADQPARISRRIAAVDAEIRQLMGPAYRRSEAAAGLPAGRPTVGAHLNRSCE